MTLLELFFWSAVLVLVYAYAVYPLLVVVLAAARPKRSTDTPDPLPPITLVIPAYRESGVLAAKLENTAELDYPEDRLEVLVVTDEADAETDALLARHPRVRHLRRPERRGKSAALNGAMKDVRTPWTVITDANAMLAPESLRALASHFGDAAVGAVSGEKRVLDTGTSGEGLYWRYESFLKRRDARAKTVVGAAGELLAFRTVLWSGIEDDTILDDFVFSMRIAIGGHVVGYEPRALATEPAPASPGEAWERRVRNAAGGWQAMCRLPGAWNPLRQPLLFFLFVSHRVLRWTLAPVALLIAAVSLIALALTDERYVIPLGLAGIGFIAALVGMAFPRHPIGRPGRLIAHFALMHAAVLFGVARFVLGRQSAAWEKPSRSAP